jgi:hypothetical protein
LFLEVAQLAIVALIILFMVSQIIIPFLRGTVMFPIFSKEVVLQEDLEKVKQESVEADMIKEIVVLKKAVEEKLKEVSEDTEKKSHKKRV